MKKALVILIIALSIVSIVVVGFMGSDLGGIYPRVYIDSLRILDQKGNEAVENRKTKERWITVDYYDRTSYFEYVGTREVEVDGVKTIETYNYIEYVFGVYIEPTNVTEAKYQFVIAPDLSFVHFSSRAEDAPFRGMFQIDEIDDFSYDILGTTSYSCRIECRSADGGSASDWVWLKVDYSKRPTN